MTGEVNLNGLFVPTLLVLGMIAGLATMLLIRIADYVGFYRLVAYRALVDLALFVITFGAIAFFAPHLGFAP